MIEFRTALKTYLKSIHPDVIIDGKNVSRVYFQAALDLTPFPYLVYDIPSIYDDGEGAETATVDVDAWGNATDTTAIETLIASVNAGLNKAVLASGNLTAAFYLDTKLALTDDDPSIRRRKYVYQAKLFRRG